MRTYSFQVSEQESLNRERASRVAEKFRCLLKMKLRKILVSLVFSKNLPTESLGKLIFVDLTINVLLNYNIKETISEFNEKIFHM